VWDLRFSQRYFWRFQYSVMWCTTVVWNLGYVWLQPLPSQNLNAITHIVLIEVFMFYVIYIIFPGICILLLRQHTIPSVMLNRTFHIERHLNLVLFILRDVI
jgi:hypothetical protein